EENLKKLEAAAQPGAYIISSSMPMPASNEPGDNPPHALGKHRYEEIIEAGHFLCTQEHPSNETPVPIIFSVTETGIDYTPPGGKQAKKASALAQAAAVARGGTEPPKDHVGFGKA